MATINVYQQYFSARCTAKGVERHAAAVYLISDSDAGTIRYEAAVTFFPHTTPDDFAVSYDAYYTRVLYEAQGRRSRKREEVLLQTLRHEIDALAAEAAAEVFWDKPVTEAQRG